MFLFAGMLACNRGVLDPKGCITKCMSFGLQVDGPIIWGRGSDPKGLITGGVFWFASRRAYNLGEGVRSEGAYNRRCNLVCEYAGL